MLAAHAGVKLRPASGPLKEQGAALTADIRVDLPVGEDSSRSRSSASIPRCTSARTRMCAYSRSWCLRCLWERLQVAAAARAALSWPTGCRPRRKRVGCPSDTASDDVSMLSQHGFGLHALRMHDGCPRL